MATNKRNSEGGDAFSKPSDACEKSVTTGSDIDRRKSSVHLETANVSRRHTWASEKTMKTNKQKSEANGALGKQNDASKKSVTIGSDNDRRKSSVHLETANVNTINKGKIGENTFHRTITLHVPLYNKQFYLKRQDPIRSGIRTMRTTKLVQATIGEGSQTEQTVSNSPPSPSPSTAVANPVISIMNNRRISLAILVILISLISSFIYSSYSSMCDMSKVENRDFNTFYGILPNKNHFIAQTTVECDSDTIFQSVLPQAVLNSVNTARSFMVLAKYGTGKTLLRCQYFKSLPSNNYFKILILNKQINEYFGRFVTETSINEKYCDNENCVIKWSQNEFAQLLLSILVTQFVNAFEKENFELPNISLDEKIELITIICYYYNEQGLSKLEYFVNSFLKKTDNSMYSASKAQGQIIERSRVQDKPLLLHFKTDLKKLSILQKDVKKLELLLGIIEGEEYQHIAIQKTMFDNVFNSLTGFTLFMKNEMKKSVGFVIDEIQYILEQKTNNKISLELFYRSSISQEILSAVMAQNFYLSLFYPEVDGINIRDVIIGNDKFPIYTIEWDTRSLINYGDYLLQKMNKDASIIRCKSLPDFKTLVNYHDIQIADIINRISTPKALLDFMEKLIIEMNNCANAVEKPFIATYENINNAFKKSIE